MRTPRSRPDLRLAESYIPAAMACLKGMLYTLAICTLTRNGVGPYMWVIALYYDHIWTLAPSSFLDSTSICTDIVAGTMVMLQQPPHQQHSNNYMGGAGLAIWSVLGACHVYLGRDGFLQQWTHSKHNNNNVLQILLHIIPIACFSMVVIRPSAIGKRLIMMMDTNNNATGAPMIVGGSGEDIVAWPFMCRSMLYLCFMMVDIYTLRPPTQRERDRIGMLRYGAVLFAPVVGPLLGCSFVLAAAQVARLSYCAPFSTAATEELPITNASAMAKQQVHIPTNNNKMLHHHLLLSSKPAGLVIMPPAADTTNINFIHHNNNSEGAKAVDNLAFDEAFKLAKMQYQDGRHN